MEKLPSIQIKNNQELIKTKTEKLKEIAKTLKVSYGSVSNYISLLDLPKTLQNLIETDHLIPREYNMPKVS